MKPLFFLLLLSSLTTNLHAQFLESFSDGDFSANPAWQGNTDRFLVNTRQELQLNDLAPAANNTTYLAARAPTSLNDSTIWECYVRLEFATSTTNFARVYLQANQPDLSGNLTGYFVKIGGVTGNTDALELYRQDGATSTLLLAGQAGAVGGDTVTVRLRVTRSTDGTWTLLADYKGGTNFENEGSVTDARYPGGSFFGFYARYTSTRSKAFFFDEVRVDPLFVDKIAPVLQKVTATSADQVELTYDEPLDTTSASNQDNYIIDKNIGKPISAVLIAPDKILLTLNNSLESAVNYTLTATGIADASGNRSAAQTKTFIFYDIQPIAAGDLVLNEILFNPASGGSDFVELYNRSDKVLNLNGLQIINAQKTGSTASRSVTKDFLLLPKSYVAISEEPQDLKNRYQPPQNAQLLENDLPSLDDDEGNVTLRFKGITLDSFDYQDDLHFPLLNDKNGVSLERISTTALTQNADNWHSAAASVRFATPGYQNSQFFPTDTTNSDLISIANKTFSPDGDGTDDFLLLEYRSDQPGWTANIRIFDANGRQVKRLVQNELLAATGTFKWDGLLEDQTKARIGIYILWIELVATDGSVRREKQTCVLAGRLD